MRNVIRRQSGEKGGSRPPLSGYLPYHQYKHNLPSDAAVNGEFRESLMLSAILLLSSTFLGSLALVWPARRSGGWVVETAQTGGCWARTVSKASAIFTPYRLSVSTLAPISHSSQYAPQHVLSTFACRITEITESDVNYSQLPLTPCGNTILQTPYDAPFYIPYPVYINQRRHPELQRRQRRSGRLGDQY